MHARAAFPHIHFGRVTARLSSRIHRIIILHVYRGGRGSHQRQHLPFVPLRNNICCVASWRKLHIAVDGVEKEHGDGDDYDGEAETATH